MFLLLTIMPFASSIAVDDRKPALMDGGEFDCLPVSTFGLEGLRLWEPEESIRKLLGEPQSIVIGWSEDDGGRHDVRTHHYENLEIDAVRGNVDRIFTDSRNVSMPSGIRVGDNMEEVVNILGRMPRGWTAAKSEFYIVTCPVDGKWVQEDYVTLEFDSSNILLSIEYAANRP